MVFVTGATGILGRMIILELLKKGEKVRAGKRPNSDTKDVEHSYQYFVETPKFYFEQIEWIDIDFEDIHSLQKALEGITHVYHCAAKVSFHPKDEKEMYKTNIKGTENLVFACENSSVEKFLHVSSIAVLDGKNDEGKLDEESDFNPKIDHPRYAISKHLSEMEVWRASAEGLNTIIINPGIIIGTGNWSQSSGELFSTFEKNNFTFSGGTSYVDVRDVARIAIQLMAENKFGERYIVISENRKYKDVGNFIRQKLGLKPAKILSKAVMNFAFLLNFPFSFLFPKLKLLTRANIDSVNSMSIITNQKVVDTLSYTFIKVEDSIDFHLSNYINDKKHNKI
ncbi:NAD-dependent epimerase/dehydratase family protein [Chryseobacterium sp.]|uniref:NAD-dependent epimerase/dehydratase family protein n=1 Tax=Chryseobacterium sp. TaxID=1871047 RepID=UPI003890D227